MADINLQLLQTDLDRIIAAVPQIETYTCDMHENPKCLVRDIRKVAQGCSRVDRREVAVVNREELQRLKRELLEFRHRWKEHHA